MTQAILAAHSYSTRAIELLLNLLSGLSYSFVHWFQVIGYSRAAAELSRQGLHEEAKKCMLELAKLK